MGALFVKPLAFSVVSANQNAVAPATNANLDQPALVWRSNNLTTINVIIDMGTSASYDTVALIGTNLRATDTVQVRTGTTTTGTGSYAGTAQAAFAGALPDGSTAKAIFKLSSTRTERYVRIDIVSTGNPSGYTEVQRVVVGKACALTGIAGVDLGHQISFVDPSVAYQYNGGESYDRYQRLPQMKFTVSMVTDADWRADWYGFLQDVGISKAFLVVPDDSQPANWQTEAIFGRVNGQIAMAEVTMYNYRKIELQVRALSQ